MLFILFQLGPDRYLVPAAEIVEVLPLMTVKTIPGAPRGLAGLMDYRGTAVPAIDLSWLALGQPAERRVSTRVLVARYRLGDGAERRLGLIAEHATEMLSRDPGEFHEAGPRTEQARYLGPVTRDDRGLIQWINIAELLDAPLRAALFPETKNEMAALAASDGGTLRS